VGPGWEWPDASRVQTEQVAPKVVCDATHARLWVPDATDAVWDRSGMTHHGLAVLPRATHHDIAVAPALASTVAAYLDAE